MAECNVLQNLQLCTQKSVCATNLGPYGEIGANFSLQLSSRTRFDKINKQKVIAENQCEKHKKSSLVFVNHSQQIVLDRQLLRLCNKFLKSSFRIRLNSQIYSIRKASSNGFAYV